MRKTLIMILIALALAAYVYFYEIKGGEERAREKDIAEKLIHFEPDSIRVVEIQSADQDFRFERMDDGWIITRPVNTGADESAVNTLLNSLANAKKERSFAILPQQADRYGLGATGRQVRLEDVDGKPRVLVLGNDTGIGSNIYASVTDTMVHTVGKSIATNTDKSLFDWRNKKVIHLDWDALREIVLANPNGSFHFIREGEQWNLTRPLTTPAENSAVQEMLNKLDNGRIKSVVAENADDLGRYQLNRPAYRVELISGKERARTNLIFSRLKANSSYASDAARPHIFTVDSAFVKPFDKDLFAYREKRLLDFDTNSADRLNLLYDGSLMKFTKDSTGDWTLASGEKAITWKISSLLSTIKNLKAASFVHEDPTYLMPYGLVNPEGRVEVFAGDDLIAELDIGFKKGGGAYARNPRSKPVVMIPGSKLEEIFPDREDILDETETSEQTTEP